jgi:NADH:ubiquinone oxidoreductase subunit K
MDEQIFKLVFFLAVLVFCVLVVGVFLLLCKILLLFSPELHLMGMILTYP